MADANELSPPNNNAELRRPQDTGPLKDRMFNLSRQRLLTNAERAEHTAIAHLLIEGHVTTAEVMQALARYAGISSTSRCEELLGPVRRDCDHVWQNLASLSEGREVKGVDEQTQSSEWIKCMMHSLESTINSPDNSDSLYEAEALLPPQLTRQIQMRAAREWFGSGSRVGESLHHFIAALGYGRDGLLLAWMDALARNVHIALDDQEGSIGEAKKDALGRLELWWMVLKGFTFSAVSPNQGWSAPVDLVDNPDITERIVSALSSGLKALTQDGATMQWQWQAHEESGSELIATTELIARLQAAVARAAEEANRFWR